MALTDQVLMPGSDYQAICDATRDLTGTTATLKSGEVADAITSAKKVTAVWNMEITPPSTTSEITFDVNFQSNSQNFTAIIVNPDKIYYKNSDGVVLACDGGLTDWVSTSILYRKIIITGSYSNDFKTWLEANAEKQADDLAIQSPRTVNIGYVGQTIAPNAPYDAMKTLTIGSLSDSTVTADLSMASGNMTVTAPSNKGYMTKLTITKPSTLIPENIKSGVDIGGVTGTLEEGSGGGTYITVSESAPTSSDGSDGDIWVVASNSTDSGASGGNAQ